MYHKSAGIGGKTNRIYVNNKHTLHKHIFRSDKSRSYYVVLFLASRCIPHRAGSAEGTWQPCVKDVRRFY